MCSKGRRNSFWKRKFENSPFSMNFVDSCRRESTANTAVSLLGLHPTLLKYSPNTWNSEFLLHLPSQPPSYVATEIQIMDKHGETNNNEGSTSSPKQITELMLGKDNQNNERVTLLGDFSWREIRWWFLKVNTFHTWRNCLLSWTLNNIMTQRVTKDIRYRGQTIMSSFF